MDGARLEAVVMAAGEGRRLRPLTDDYAKPVLPIDGRPVVATLLRELAEAGCTSVTVVTGHLAEQVEALLGDGSAFGVRVRYARQPEPHGSADAVRRALAAGAHAPCVVVGADTLFSTGDLGRFAEAVDAAAGAIAVRRDPPPSPPHRHAVRVVDGLVKGVLDEDPANPFAGAPLWWVGRGLVAYLEELPGPPYELATAFQAAIDAGEKVIGVEIGATRDLTRPVDLLRENFGYLRAL